MNQILVFLIVIFISSVSYAGCITPDSSDDETEEKKVDEPPSIRQNHPPAGGILGWMLDFVNHGTWYHCLFGALNPLDHLALAATEQRADNIVPSDIVLRIGNDHDLARLFELEGTRALTHIAELTIAFEGDDPNAALTQIVSFLGKNAHLLTELRILDLAVFPDRYEEDLFILKAALGHPGLRALLLQTGFLLHINIHDQARLPECFALLARLELDEPLFELIDLEVASDVEPLHEDLFEVLWHTKWRLAGLRSLTIRGAGFEDNAMGYLSALVTEGRMRGLRHLDIADSGLGRAGLQILSEALGARRFSNLVTFRFEDQIDGGTLTQEDALSYLTGIFRTYATLKEFTFISNTIISHSAFENFFTKVFHSFLFSFELNSLTLGGLTDAHLQTLRHMAHRFQTLEVLDLRGNDLITEEAVNALQKALPNCQILWNSRRPQPGVFSLEWNEDDLVRPFYRE